VTGIVFLHGKTKMNKLIKELAEQAKKYALDAMIKITDKEQALKVYSESYDTKFAELIVRECAEVCYDHSNAAGGIDAYKLGRKWASGDVLNHFGVEE
jgi:heterodisulfide reductase subunit A-like polyferredoxin